MLKRASQQTFDPSYFVMALISTMMNNYFGHKLTFTHFILGDTAVQRASQNVRARQSKSLFSPIAERMKNIRSYFKSGVNRMRNLFSTSTPNQYASNARQDFGE